MKTNLSKEQIITALRAGDYSINFESDCSCSIVWEIEQLKQDYDTYFGLQPDIVSDCCWIGKVLSITINGESEAIAENIAYEPLNSLVKNISYEEIEEIFDEVTGKSLSQEMMFDENRGNPDHEKRLKESLIDFINENEYKCYIHYPRNFGNEYTCILTEKDVPQDKTHKFDNITAEEFADMKLKKEDVLTKYYRSFDFIEE